MSHLITRYLPYNVSKSFVKPQLEIFKVTCHRIAVEMYTKRLHQVLER